MTNNDVCTGQRTKRIATALSTPLRLIKERQDESVNRAFQTRTERVPNTGSLAKTFTCHVITLRLGRSAA